ncbi:nicotinate-nucleotide--dimethylbenzimidazole phosphoribosyltransferase [Butyrivibrio sp. YAB3001]|uniref:nicotinate-nucleotide--dimethylbenzimidazole phosphoribosyltransferase n=1 Tax=Butyrivibrio sp. YAB3001 TaxID=1520812 RepID=UPI0008F64BA8|nr:nicotinate-nucleotide--dimethylbenzimidazole phosphoribosyltransferase [Butyrivibrio sp. YAB3001]SFC55100.1 nicotinate-nucleotide-dimethylbenzimidazole phosphoribosyltransferase [Butyrivibrio sp. YAB3001]
MLDFKSLTEIKIEKPDFLCGEIIKKCWDSVSKPIDGLGDFENLICRIGAIQRRNTPDISKRAALIFCADNGIVEEGVSQSGKEITLSVAKALGSGISSACHLGRFAKVEVIPVDVGIDSSENISGVVNKKVARGTRNFLKDPAITKEETILAIDAGISEVKELSEKGYRIIATGEMGIGNTTTSTAVLCAMLGIDVGVTGRGAGLSDEGLGRKKRVIQEGISRYSFDKINEPKERAFEILRCVGGLDIAALAGAFIGGAIYHIPMVLDGVISSAAALVAEALLPGVKYYLIPSHKGREKGNELALNALGLSPFLNGNMALGEGTGAIMLFPTLDMVMDYYEHGARFEDYNIDKYERFGK